MESGEWRVESEDFAGAPANQKSEIRNYELTYD
jgi:hypothetical protein